MQKPGRGWALLVPVMVVVSLLRPAHAQESLVAHYAMDEGEGAVTKDNTASQYHSGIGKAAWATEGGRTALDFEDKATHLGCGPAGRLGLKQEATFSLWAFPRKIPPNKKEPVLFGGYPGTLGLTYYQGRVYFYLRAPDKQYRAVTSVAPGRWVHIAAVADGRTLKLYIDHVLRNTQSIPEGTLLPVDGHFTIGGRPGGTSFPGLIADARIYRTALSIEQIRRLVPAALKSFETMLAGPWTSLALPPGDGTIRGLEESGVSDWQRHAGKVITPMGIPFKLSTSLVSGVRTALAEKESAEFQVSPAARTLYLLMAVHLPRKAPGRRGKPYPMSQASCPHRLACELTLEDGAREWVVPLDMQQNGHHWTHGVGAYALTSLWGKRIRKVTLHDKMDSAALGVMAATTSAKAPTQRPKLHAPHYTSTPWKGAVNPLPKPKQSVNGVAVRSTDGVMAVACDASKGRPVWSSLGILPVRMNNVLNDPGPVWDVQVKNQGNAQWKHDATRLTENGFEMVSSLAPAANRRLRTTLKGEWDESGSLILSVTIQNVGKLAERIETLKAPMLSNVLFDSPGDTWYWCTPVGGVVNNLSIDYRYAYGVWHPLQADGFFSPSRGWGLGLMTRDTEGVFRYFAFKKTVQGGSYAQEYLPRTLDPGQTRETVPLAVRAMPGDWKAQFNWYKAWLSTWWRPASPPKPWFRRSFSFINHSPWSWSAAPGIKRDKRDDFAFWVDRYTKMVGAIDIFYMYGWSVESVYKDSHDGVYNYDGWGGKEKFAGRVASAQQTGTRMGLYFNGYLAHTKAEKLYPPLKDMRKWQMFGKDGKRKEDDWGNPARLTAYMCPSQKGWRDYLIEHVYTRVRRDTGLDLFYIDQYGSNRMMCYRAEHGHPVPLPGLPYEQVMLEALRKALDGDAATFTEYFPADVTAQYIDGAYGHAARYGSEDVGRALRPHIIDLPRFALPSVKSFDLISRPAKNGSVDYQKVFLFNGDVVYMASYLVEGSDPEGRAWLGNSIRVLKKYADAFASDDVEPLVDTLIPGVYANRFEGEGRTVWTFYNATPHSIDAGALSLPAQPNVTYYDPYYDRPVKPVIRGDRHLVAPLVWPNDVGCLVRELAK